MNKEIETLTRWQDTTIEMLNKKIDAQDKIINTQALEIADLREETEKLTALWLESQNKRRKAIEYIKHSQSYGTIAQVMPHLKPYVNGDDLLELLGDKE